MKKAADGESMLRTAAQMSIVVDISSKTKHTAEKQPGRDGSREDLSRMQNLQEKIQRRIEEGKEGVTIRFKPKLKARKKDLKQEAKYKELVDCIN
jgi:hypothetical protein